MSLKYSKISGVSLIHDSNAVFQDREVGHLTKDTPAMIDKLDFEISVWPEHFSPAFQRCLSDPDTFAGKSVFRGFEERRELRRFDWPIVIHKRRFMGSITPLRIEILQAGRNELRETLSRVEDALGTTVADARVMRFDLAVDVKDVSMEWVRRHVWVRSKRLNQEFSKKRQDDRSGILEGITFGGPRNQVAIYDKTLQQRVKGKRQAKGMLTRFERRYIGQGISQKCKTIAGLLDQVVFSRPFSIVHFEPIDRELQNVDIDGLSGTDLLKVVGFSYLRRNLGLAKLRKRLGPNYARTLKEITAKLRIESHDALDLNALFEQSMRQQLSAAISTQFED
jgi:hypothetical protein